MSKVDYRTNYIDPQDFNETILKLRDFFLENGFIETFPQPKLTILAACEDPKTVKSFEFDGQIWPLPQTNQMNLEEELMLNQDKVDGLFCLTSSYRDEPNPTPGRHMKTFPMFEAEHKGNFENLIETISNCCLYLGLVDDINDIPIMKYNDLCKHYNVSELTSEHETKMWKEFGNVIAITYFPERTSPFFNMKEHGYENGEKISRKVDFIIYGQETFGCAERESDSDTMLKNFHTISDGEYANLLYEKFGKERVIQELNTFLELPMIERWGFGCGLTRLVRAINIKKSEYLID